MGIYCSSWMWWERKRRRCQPTVVGFRNGGVGIIQMRVNETPQPLPPPDRYQKLGNRPRLSHFFLSVFSQSRRPTALLNTPKKITAPENVNRSFYPRSYFFSLSITINNTKKIIYVLCIIVHNYLSLDKIGFFLRKISSIFNRNHTYYNMNGWFLHLFLALSFN